MKPQTISCREPIQSCGCYRQPAAQARARCAWCVLHHPGVRPHLARV